MAYQPLEDFITTDADRSSRRIRDMPYGMKRFSLRIEPAELIFPKTKKGMASGAQIVVLYNIGYDSLTINGATVTGDFRLLAPLDAYPTEILPGESYSIQVTYCPQTTAPAPHTGGLYIQVPETAEGEEFVPLSGSSDFNPAGSFTTDFIIATNQGTGTPNYIQATTEYPVPFANGDVLIGVNLLADNTSKTVQIAFNKDAPLFVKNNLGEDFDIGDLAKDSMIIGYKLDNTFRVFFDKETASMYGLLMAQYEAISNMMITKTLIGDIAPIPTSHGQFWWESDSGSLYICYQDGDSLQWVEIFGPAFITSINDSVARAEAAAADAKLSSEKAAGYVSDVVVQGEVPIFSTIIGMPAILVPEDMSYIYIGGYYAVGDGGGGYYKRVTSMPAHRGRIQTAGGIWWELTGDYVKPEMFGAIGDGISDDTTSLISASDAGVGIKAELLFTQKYLAITDIAITPRIHFSEHGGLKAASGIEVLLNGGFEAPLEAHIFDISAGGFIWPIKASTLTQYHYGAINDIAIDSTAALQALIDANLYKMQSDAIRFLHGRHRTTKPLIMNYYSIGFRGIDLVGAGTVYDSSTQNNIGTSIISDHWECALEIQGTRYMVIKSMTFFGPFQQHIVYQRFGGYGYPLPPRSDPYPLENWLPKTSQTPDNPFFINAGTDAPTSALSRFAMCAAVHVDPRSGPKPVANILPTPVRFMAWSGDLATAFENGDIYDGLTLATGDRFLYVAPLDTLGNTGHPGNGVYVVQATGAAVRATDLDATAEFVNVVVSVTAGTHAGTQWICDTAAVTLGPISPIQFRKYDGKVAYDDYAYPSWVTTTQYNKPFSQSVVLQDCFISGFGAAFAVQGCDADGNGDNMKMLNCGAFRNVYGFVWGNTQARDTVARDGNFAFNRVAFSTGVVGRQNGKTTLAIDNCAINFGMDIIDILNANVGGGVALVNCYSEGINRIGNCFASGTTNASLLINGGMYEFGHASAWGRRPGYIINAGNCGISIIGGVTFMHMYTPLIIAADPRNCHVEITIALPLWFTGVALPASIPIHDAIMIHSTMDVMFLDPNQGPWTGKGYNGSSIYSVTTGGTRSAKQFGAHALSSVTNPIPFCARTAGGDSNKSSHGIPVALGTYAYQRTSGDAVLVSHSPQTDDTLVITLNAAVSAGDAMQRGWVPGSIVYNAHAKNLYVVTSLVGTTMTLRQLNNIDLATNTTTSPYVNGQTIYFIPTGHYTPNSGLELTYTSGSPNMTFQRSDGVTTDNAQLPVGAARVAWAAGDAMTPVTQAGSMITASAAGAITFSGNARRTTVERAELFYIPRP
jgi:hypothetical protein